MKYKSIIFLILLFLLMGVASASENMENDTSIAIDEEMEDNSVGLQESDEIPLSDSTDEDLLEYTISDQNFKIDTTKEKNYGRIRIDSGAKTAYFSTDRVSWKEYTPKHFYSFNSGSYSVIDVELPKKAGHYKCSIITWDSSFQHTYNFEMDITYCSFITVENKSIDAGKYSIINFNVNSTQKSRIKNITVTINDEIYDLSGNSNRFGLTLSKPGRYYGYAKVNLYGDYETSSEKFYVDVYEEPLIVAQDYYITQLGEEYSFNIYAVDSNGDAINSGQIYLNRTSSDVRNGCAKFTINPENVGIEYYSVNYVPSKGSHYKKVSLDSILPIATISKTALSVEPVSAIAGSKMNLKYSLKDNLGNEIPQYGYFIVNGVKYDCLYDVRAPEKAGTYTWTVKFVSEYILYSNSSAQLKIINKYKTKVQVKSVKGYENRKVRLTATVTGNAGEKVKKGTVIFKVKGKKYKAAVKNGKAVKTVKIPKPKSRAIYYSYSHKNGREIQTAQYESETYKCSVTFKGDNDYLESHSTFKITSKKASKSKVYKSSYSEPSKSVKKSKKTSKTKKTKKSKKTKDYGYYPTYNKPAPTLDADLFKKEPAIDPNVKLSDIIITTD